jgi:L-threonylcarbamoyladenylate synthase
VHTELLNADMERLASGAPSRAASIARSVALLEGGRLVAFPTDTVYGVAAIITDPSAVARLYVAKQRPPEKAIPILIARVNELERIAKSTSDTVWRLVERFWPGALTLILPKSEFVPREVSPTADVAVRLPDLALTREIISAVGVPLAVTSANRSGEPSPRTALEVMDQLDGRIAAVLDGGPTPGGVPSTILDCTVTPPRIVRAGAISASELSQVTRLA